MRKYGIICLIIVLCASFIPIPAGAVTLAEYEQKLQNYINQANANQAALNKTKEEIAATNNQIATIKQEMQNLANEIVTLNKQIDEYNVEIKEKSLQTKEIFEYFQMSKGENVYYEYAFGAETITDLIYRMAVVEQMTEYNDKITKELEQMIEVNNKRKAEIDVKTKEMTAKKGELEKKLISLGNTKSSLTTGGVTIQEQVNIYRQLVQSYKAQGCKSSDVIGVTCATSGSSGVWRRPVSYGYITSEFGYRWGSFHRGVDISNGDPYNTKIYPVANGTISAKWVDPNGALVLAIEHYDAVTGRYYTSLYGHMSSYAPGLYVGKYMTSDTYLGYMGMSGYATGPHLHLEIGRCRLYVDSNCYSFASYTSFIYNDYLYNGYKGPGQLINLPYEWYSR